MLLRIYFFPPYPRLAKAQAIVNDGLLQSLVCLDELEMYWGHMLRDFPGPPIGSCPAAAICDTRVVKAWLWARTACARLV